MDGEVRSEGWKEKVGRSDCRWTSGRPVAAMAICGTLTLPLGAAIACCKDNRAQRPRCLMLQAAIQLPLATRRKRSKTQHVPAAPWAAARHCTQTRSTARRSAAEHSAAEHSACLLLLGQLLGIAHQAASINQQKLVVAPKRACVQPGKGKSRAGHELVLREAENRAATWHSALAGATCVQPGTGKSRARVTVAQHAC